MEYVRRYESIDVEVTRPPLVGVFYTYRNPLMNDT